MLKHVTFLGSAALAIALSTGVVAQDVTAATVVAKVGATEITMGEIIIARAQLPPQYAQFPNAVLLEGIIDQLIQQQLLADTLDAVPARIDYTLQNERRSLLAAEVISAITQQAVTEDALQAAFDARFADAAGVNEFNASHLLVETEEEARAAKTRIDDGAAFADVARDVSTGPTGPNGGNLGWFEAGAMVPEFETAIMALGVGDVSEPFETQFGWHVATLNEIRVQPLPTLDEMRRELTDVLQEAAVTARLDEPTTEKEVVKPAAGDFDPDLIDNLDLLDQ